MNGPPCHSLITIMSKSLLRISDFSSKNLKPATLLMLICQIFRFLEYFIRYFIRIVDNSSSLRCTSLDDSSDEKVKALESSLELSSKYGNEAN